MSRRVARLGGFTLVELMITVAIVGVLATLAVFAVRKYVRSAAISEGTEMITGILANQQAYFAEVGTYADISASITADTSKYFPTPLEGKVTDWEGACGAKCKTGMSWNLINVKASGPVRFGYATIASSTQVPSARNGGPIAPTGAFPSQMAALDSLASTPAIHPWAAVGALSKVYSTTSVADGIGIVGTTLTNQIIVDDSNP